MWNTVHVMFVRLLVTIVWIFVIYKPFRFFFLSSVPVAGPGLGSTLRFLYFYLSGEGGGHAQSLVITAASTACAAMLCIGGLLADLIAANLALLEELQTRSCASRSNAESRFKRWSI